MPHLSMYQNDKIFKNLGEDGIRTHGTHNVYIRLAI